jgi:hypothetical protein
MQDVDYPILTWWKYMLSVIYNSASNIMEINCRLQLNVSDCADSLFSEIILP